MQTVERYENTFLVLCVALMVGFLAALAYGAVGAGKRLPDKAGVLDPAKIYETAPFNAPGVRETAPGEYEAVVVGQIWAFAPNEVRVPKGAEVTFKATSADVIHGFYVEGTTVNGMLVPGHVTEIHHRFDEPGEHLIICHEYCGAGHHMMYGKVIVE
ncbi:MAG: cytochrome c oxidase subunit II [Candidatus Methylomirabilis sp.]|nr:cytochrome c oxidase subunit II [Deltaproteobacteria bacterium]